MSILCSVLAALAKVEAVLNELKSKKEIKYLQSQISSIQRSNKFTFIFSLGFSGFAVGVALILYSLSTSSMFKMFSTVLSTIENAPTLLFPTEVLNALYGGIVAAALGFFLMIVSVFQRWFRE